MGQETSLEIRKLEEDLFVVSYRGEDGLTEFLNRGGASSDEEVIRVVQDWLSLEDTCLQMRESSFGCSTISARGSQGVPSNTVNKGAQRQYNGLFLVYSINALCCSNVNACLTP